MHALEWEYKCRSSGIHRMDCRYMYLKEAMIGVVGGGVNVVDVIVDSQTDLIE